MAVYIHTKFKGHNRVGVAAVVNAPDLIHAQVLLEAELKSHSLKQKINYTDFVRIDTSINAAYVLNDGDY